jgi:Tripartite tricarboxylate transporter TctB family
MLTTNRVSGSALVLFALLVIWECRHLPLGTFRLPGPAFVPVLLASLLLTFGLLLIVSGKNAALLSSLTWTEWRHALAILAACAFTVFAIERLGYRVTVMLALVFLLKLVERRGWVLSLTFAFALSFGSFFLFHSILRVPLPRGPFGF